MTNVSFGDGSRVTATLGDGTVVFGGGTSVGLVEFTASGATFEPSVELMAGSSALVEWQDAGGGVLAVGTDPVIDFGSAAIRTVRMRVASASGMPRYSHVRSLNLGFDHTNDSGQYNIGAAYDKDPTGVIAVAGLHWLSGLRYFMAANTELAGHLDFTGCAHLEYIECFLAHVESVDLTGCDSLIRLCLEECSIAYLDLNPVRATLRDCRAAVQHSGPGGITFATLSGPIQLYHYCIRDNAVHNVIPHSQLPVMEEFWVWNAQLAAVDPPTSPLLRSFSAYDNALDEATVDAILVALAEITSASFGSCRLQGAGMAAPTAVGTAAADVLRGRAWSVTLNGA